MFGSSSCARSKGATGVTYWFGIPRQAAADNLLLLLVGDAASVVPVNELTAEELHMTRPADCRLTPYVVEVNARFEQRVPDASVVVSLEPYRNAYGRCLEA